MSNENSISLDIKTPIQDVRNINLETKNNVSKMRDSNIELLRVLLSFLVIAWHVAVKYTANGSGTWTFNVLQPLLVAPVITFGLISGFFLRKSNRINWKFLLYTLCYYWFISIASTIILASLGVIPWTRPDNKTPIDQYALGLILSGGGYWWYMFAFVFVSLIMPLINIGLEQKNSLKLEIILVVSIWLLTSNNNIWFTISDNNANQPGDFDRWAGSVTNYAKWSISLLNAYLIGGILMRYGNKMFNLKAIPIYISVLILCMMIAILEKVGLYSSAKLFGRELFLDHSDFTTPIVAISIFSIFASLKIGSNKFINYIAKQTLSIYLFQFIFITLLNYTYTKNVTIIDNSELRFLTLSIIGWFSVLLFSIIINTLKDILFKKILKK